MSDAPDAPTTPPRPSRLGPLLALVRRLIDYGRDLAASLRQPATADLLPISRAFGTRDIALILARITRGLLMAGALEARLLRRGAYLDAPPDTPRTPRATPAEPTPAPPPRSRTAARPDIRLDPLPTAEQIADAIRHRPIGAVIADICRDLGIRPSHPLWGELRSLIIRHGGSLARLVSDILDLVLPLPPPHATTAGLAPAPAALGTRPP
ncbi:MAG: hypothetical protein WDN25_20430 [Acetobacteraceae bacterium]